MSDWIVIFSSEDVKEAGKARAALQEAEIESAMHLPGAPIEAEDPMPDFPAFKLAVKKTDADAARKVLEKAGLFDEE